MIPNEALKLIIETVRPLATAALPLPVALGHCLAQEVRADRDLPPADRSAMDGYAVRAADLAEVPGSLRLAGEVAAGSPARPRVRPGSCVRILTGANVPPGADTVVMVEQTEERGGLVVFRAPAAPGANILRRGEDAARGAVLLAKGTRLGAMQIGVCAAVGKARVRVFRRPRVAVLATGAELRPAGGQVGAHQSRNSNGPMLRAALETWGYPEVDCGTAPDRLAALVSKLRRAVAGHDVLLLTGGVSVGKYDFVRRAVEAIGGRVRFHGVAMKPGKPVLYATLRGNRHIFGLPGNPLSAMTGFYEFALPALRRLSGVAAAECRPAMLVPVGTPLVSRGGPARFVLARLTWGVKGPTAEPVRSRSSADLVAGGRADGVIAVPPGVRELAAGALVEFRPWRPLP